MLSWDEYSEEPGRLLTEEEKMGAQILRASVDYDLLLLKGLNHSDALQKLNTQDGVYNPRDF